MRPWTRVAAVVVAAAAIVGPATTAGAEERTCRGALGRVTVDNLRVPARATCSLTGTTVDVEVKWVFDEAVEFWRPNVTSAVMSPDGGVHVGASTDTGYQVFGLDPATGDVRWSQRVDSRNLRPDDPQSPPWVVQDRVYFSTLGDRGSVADTEHGTTQVFDAATGEIAIGDGMIYVPTEQGLVALGI